MAIFGFQLVSTLIGASILSKLVTHFSFGRLLLCKGLVRYLHPTNKQIREAAGIVKQKDKSKRPRRYEPQDNGTTTDTFTIPKNTPLELEIERVDLPDVLPLHYFTDYQWVVDFSLMAVFVYIVSELHAAVMGPSSGSNTSGSFNLSLIWCLLGLLMAIKTLVSLTGIYFRAAEGGEAMIVVTSGFFFLVLSMAVLIMPEAHLALDLHNAYRNFSTSARVHSDQLTPEGVVSDGPISMNTFRAMLALSGAIIGALLAYPGLRYSKMYIDGIKYSPGPLTTCLFHLNFFMPLVCALLWLEPINKQFLKLKNVSFDDLTTIRLVLIIFACILRLVLIRQHLQAYLNLAHSRLEILRKEAGRISNSDLQRSVARIFYCLCVVALQYILPMITLLFFTCLYKTLGNYSWTSNRLASHLPLWNSTQKSINPSQSGQPPFNITGYFDLAEDIQKSVAAWAASIGSIKAIFTAAVYRGLFGYYVWWTLVCIQINSFFGLIYYNYVFE